MGVVIHETEFATKIPPAKMFKTSVLEYSSITKILPQAIKSVTVLEGDGGPGTIKLVEFADAAQFKYMKERIDAVDKEKFTYVFSVIEGDALKGKFEKIVNEIKFEASADGGSIVKSTSAYYPLGEVEVKLEDIKEDNLNVEGMFKVIEAYILANPEA